MIKTPLQRNSTLKSKSSLQSSQGLKKTQFKRQRPSTLQNELDGIFSEYIRRLHADQYGATQCVTCGVYARWKMMDAGHFIPRQHLGTRYDIYNVFPQCRSCNRELEGNMSYFNDYLTRAFGENMVVQLKEKSKQIIHGFSYKEKIEEFKWKLHNLRVEQDKDIQY